MAQPHPHLVIGGQEVRGKVQLAQKRDQSANRFLGPGWLAVIAGIWLGGETAAPGPARRDGPRAGIRVGGEAAHEDLGQHLEPDRVRVHLELAGKVRDAHRRGRRLESPQLMTDQQELDVRTWRKPDKHPAIFATNRSLLGHGLS